MPYQSTPEDKKRALALGVFYVFLAIALGYMLFKIWPPVPWPDAEKHPQLIAKAQQECAPSPSPTPTPTLNPTPTPVRADAQVARVTPGPGATSTPEPGATATPTPAQTATPTPTPTPLSGPIAMPINFFGRCTMTTFDERLLLLVIVAGMLGSFVHGATSLADYIGNNRFSRRWTWFYLLRPVIGMALALVFYFVIRGGFLTTNVGATDINPYGIAALAGLVGMFSKQATDKLSEVFSTLFRSGEGDQKRADPLAPGGKGTPTKIDPAEVTVGSQGITITVTGTDFVKDSIVYLDDAAQTTTFESPNQLRVDPAADAFAVAGVLKLTVETPDGTRSNALELKVVAASSTTSPSIDNVDPAEVSAGVAGVITVNGAGFVEGSTMKLNDVSQDTVFVDTTKLTVNLTATSITTAGSLKLKVVNPDGTESNGVDFTAA